MKILQPILIMGLALNTSCDKDEDQTPIEQLPPATQSGAQTFGCLINGEPFVPPKIGRNSPRAFFQYVRGAYTLGISAKKGGGDELQTVIIGAIDINSLNSGSHELTSEIPGNFFAKYLLGGGRILNSVTSNENNGVVNITNYDQEKFIISGTFSFTVKDENGNNIEITEGRFDLNYTS